MRELYVYTYIPCRPSTGYSSWTKLNHHRRKEDPKEIKRAHSVCRLHVLHQGGWIPRKNIKFGWLWGQTILGNPHVEAIDIYWSWLYAAVHPTCGVHVRTGRADGALLGGLDRFGRPSARKIGICGRSYWSRALPAPSKISEFIQQNPTADPLWGKHYPEMHRRGYVLKMECEGLNAIS